jgi:hypothetical protein
MIDGGTSAAMVDAAGDQRGGEFGAVALARHRFGHGARQHRDVGGRRPGHAGEEHRKHRRHLGQAAAHMPHQGLRQFRDTNDDVGGGH